MATVTPEGMPHVTPVDSLVPREPGHAIYFEEFTTRMPRNFLGSQHLSVLAVRSGAGYWPWSMIRGGFSTPPAIRLYGTVGVTRRHRNELLGLHRAFKYGCQPVTQVASPIRWGAPLTTRS